MRYPRTAAIAASILPRTLVLGLVLLACPLISAAAEEAEQVNVYSARHDSVIEPLLERFTEETGIEVGLVTGSSDAMIKRLEIEGASTPADVLIAVDAARLHRAKEAGLLRSVESETLTEAVPSHLRDPDNRWFGLSRRARVIAYSDERVEPDALSSYADLTADHWDDRICVRSSDNVYNQSLLASIIAARGTGPALNWTRGIVENMARRPQGGDTEQIRAIASGICDLALVNTYYYARLANAEDDPEARAIADKVSLLFPNQDGRGTHVNVTGGGVLRHAPHPQAGRRLLEFLLRPESQAWLAQANYEYPVRAGVDVSDAVADLGPYPFVTDDTPLGRIGALNGEAVRIFDRAGWR